MAGIVEADLVTPASPAADCGSSSQVDVMQKTLPIDPESVVRRQPGAHRAQPRPYRRWILAVGLGVLAIVTSIAVLSNGRPSALWSSSGSGPGRPEPTVDTSTTTGPTPAGTDVTTPVSTPLPNPTSHRPATVTPEPVLLGGLNISRYCRSQGLGVAKPAGPRTTSDNWQCTHGRQATPVAMDDVCRWQYHSSTAYAKPTDPGDASSWACFA